MTIPECSPQGSSITYRSGTVASPIVYRLSLKPASPSSAVFPSSSSPTSTSTNAVVCLQNRPTIPSSASSSALMAISSGRPPISGSSVVAASGRGPRHRRHKSCTDSLLRMERMLAPAPSNGMARTRPYSAGDESDILRMVSISGFSKNSHGTWVFKVDVGGVCDASAYAVRRRFTDFKMLHEGLSEVAQLPELPPHGIVSVFQLFVSPEKLLTARAARLQELLLVIHAHPVLCKSAAFSAFIGKNPSSYDAGYVSLSGYEVPKLDKHSRFGSFDSSFSV